MHPRLTTSHHPPSIFYQIRLRTYLLTPQRRWRRNFSPKRFSLSTVVFFFYFGDLLLTTERLLQIANCYNGDSTESNDGIKGVRRPRGVVSVHWSCVTSRCDQSSSMKDGVCENNWYWYRVSVMFGRFFSGTIWQANPRLLFHTGDERRAIAKSFAK